MHVISCRVTQQKEREKGQKNLDKPSDALIVLAHQIRTQNETMG